MIHQRHASETNPSRATADSLLRDIAFVLRMTRKVKSEMLSEPALATSNERTSASRPEPGVCAV